METFLRNEYPRPQLVRKEWESLNGEWDFSFDTPDFDKTIRVPFAYQATNSGIGDTAAHDVVWYRKDFSVLPEWKGRRVILHFGAVDYLAEVTVNGKLVGRHEGGSAPFAFDITNLLTWEKETIVVRVYDPTTDETITRGKQFWREKSEAIWYTRTTGIWQSVWLEPLEESVFDKIRFTPNLDTGEVEVSFAVDGEFQGKICNIVISCNGNIFADDNIKVMAKTVSRRYDLFGQEIFRTNFHNKGLVWSPENPTLFDVKMTLCENEKQLDEISTYFGMRKVHSENGKFYLNNRPYYQRLVLDQGYWPDGVLTAPDDKDFVLDIEAAKQMGFNGCRKHQKAEDPRFLYWADRIGYLVWEECPAFVSYCEDAAVRATQEWTEIVARDYNHPSIVTWVPINESWGVPNISTNKRQQNFSLALYHLLHALDGTRLVVSNDGWEMTISDLTCVHNYNHGNENDVKTYQNFSKDIGTLDEILTAMPAARPIYVPGFAYRGEPVILSEFGGIAYETSGSNGWGYTSASSPEQLLRELSRVFKAVYDSNVLSGFCYTQLTDVEQEINGLLTYDRQAKCSLEQIRAVVDSRNNQ